MRYDNICQIYEHHSISSEPKPEIVIDILVPLNNSTVCPTDLVGHLIKLLITMQ